MALFSPGWPPGRVQNGIVTYVGQLAPSLTELGIETTIISTAQTGTTLAEAPTIDLNKMPTPVGRRAVFRALRGLGGFPLSPSTLGLAWALGDALGRLEDQGRLDLFEMEETFGAAWFVQELIRSPVIVRLHGPWFVNGAALGVPIDEDYRRRERFERRCIVEAAGVTSPSRDLLERVRREYGVALANAAVIPNAAPRIPEERHWRLHDCDRKSILFVGRFDRHKGGDIVIDAFRELAEVLPTAELIFVGPDRGLRDDAGNTWDLQAYLEQRLPAALRPRIHIRGPLAYDQIETLRRQAFLTVSPSRYENFSLALLESLSFGCPTIASATGGNVEIVLDGQSGLLCRPDDPADLARCVIALFRQPERAAEMGRRGAVDMGTRLTPLSVARTTLDYYQQVWGMQRGPRRGITSWLRKAAYQITGVA